MFKRTEENVLAFVLLFAVIGTAAHMVNVSTVWGPAGQHFTLFDFFSALPTAFLGLWSGLAAVLIAKLAAVVALGMPLDGATMLRLLPPLAAGAFFYAYKKNAQKTEARTRLAQFFQFGVPVLCIALFMLHPAIFGTLGMLFALYWTIPIIVAMADEKLAGILIRLVLAVIGVMIFALAIMHGANPLNMAAGAFLMAVSLIKSLPIGRALGATFSQHALGGVLWLYFVPGFANPAVWLALVPVVIVERAVFAGGIAVSYKVVDVAVNRVTAFLRTPDGRPAVAPQAVRKKR